MNTIIFRVLMAAVGLYVIDLLLCGFAFGFVAFLALSVSTGLVFWMYHRLIICKNQPVRNWRWERFGAAIYRMEVA